MPSPRRTHWLLFSLPVVAVAAAGVLGARWWTGAPAGVAGAIAPAGGSAAVEPWPARRQVVFEVGCDAAVAGEFPLFDLSLAGELTLRPVAVAKAPPFVEARLAPKSVTWRSAPERSAELRERLGQRAILELGAAGRIERIAFPDAKRRDAVDDMARSTLRTLHAGMQQSRPSSAVAGGDGGWETVERDLTGSYRARYEVRSASSYEKRKLGYVSIQHGQAAGARTLIDASLAKITTDGGFGLDRVTELDLAEDTRTQGAGAFPELRSKLHLTARRLRTEEVAPVTVDVASLELVALDVVDGKEVVESARAEELKGQSLAGLAAEAERLEAAGDSAKRARAYSNLAAWLRYQDASVAEAKQTILDDPQRRSLLIHALGDAGSAPAQKVLIELFRAPALGLEDRRNIVYALSMGETPIPEATAFLETLLDDEEQRVQARFGVGTNAYHAREKHPELARAAVATLGARLAQATTPGDIASYLRALGNAATPEVFGLVEPFLSDPGMGVRAAAVDALRRVPGGRTDTALARALGDAERSVRSTAVSAMGYRTPSPTLVYAVRDALLKDPDEGVRISVAGRAGDWLTQAPVLRTTLEQVSNTDASEKVRDAARRQLAKGASSGAGAGP